MPYLVMIRSPLILAAIEATEEAIINPPLLQMI